VHPHSSILRTCGARVCANPQSKHIAGTVHHGWPRGRSHLLSNRLSLMSLLSLRLGGGPVYGSQVELAATEIVTEVNAYGVRGKLYFSYEAYRDCAAFRFFDSLCVAANARRVIFVSIQHLNLLSLVYCRLRHVFVTSASKRSSSVLRAWREPTKSGLKNGITVRAIVAVAAKSSFCYVFIEFSRPGRENSF